MAGTELGRLMNTITDPMFDRMIQNVKMAVTFDALESWLKANPTASREAKLAMGRLWGPKDVLIVAREFELWLAGKAKKGKPK